MRIIILGAGGQLGRIVFETLCTEFPSAEIIGTVRQQHYHFEGVKGRTHQRSLVFDPFRDDWRALGCADALINCIGSITCKTPDEFFQVHAGISLKICTHRAELGFPRIIQVSALGADKQSPSVFLRSKAFADQIVLQQKDTWVIRPGIVCTPQTMLVHKLMWLKKKMRFFLRRSFVPHTMLNMRIQPVLADDFAALILRVLKEKPAKQIIDLPGPEELSLRELLAFADLRAHAFPQQIFDWSYRFFGRLIQTHLNREQALLLRTHNTGSTDVAEKILGRKLQNTRTFWMQEMHRGKKSISEIFA